MERVALGSDSQSTAQSEQDTIVGSPREEAEAPELTPAQWIGRYVPLRRVGRGAFGAVYAAYDPQLDRKVALKVLRAERETAHNRLRLLREARALAAVSHPNVVAVFDVGERDDGGAIHIAMEFIEGKSLREWIASTRPSRASLLATVLAVARGLVAAHAAGLAHRDIKPDNVMVTVDGTPKIVDFGLAHAGRSPSDDGSAPSPVLQDLTGTGLVVGTPAYMSPEQHEGQRGDATSDQFSFCVLAYEAFVGARPFVGGSVDELRTNIFGERVVPPPTRAMPRWLWPVLQRGLAVDPDHRFASMQDLLDEVERRRRRPRRLALGLFGLLALTPAIVLATIGAKPPCGSIDDPIDAVWNASARESIAEAFSRARPEYGAAAAERVSAFADGFATKWKTGATENCEATRVRASQSDELFDVRAACYRDGLTAFAETVRLWQEGEATVVDHALGAAWNLPPPTACASARSFRQLQPRPVDPQALAEIAAIEDELSRAQAQFRSGRPPMHLRSLDERATAVGYRPLLARVKLLEATVDRFLSVDDPVSYHSALTVALAGGDTRAAVDAALRQCSFHRVLHDFGRARESCDLAEALIETGDDGEFEQETLELEVIRAELLAGDGELEESREMLLSVRAAATAIGARKTYYEATSALARTEQGRGRILGALELMEEAKTVALEVYGPLHPNTLSIEGDTCAMLTEAGRNEEARARLEAVIATENQARGPDSPHQWQNYIHLAWTQKELGDTKAALASAEKARVLVERAKGEARAKCYVLSNLGLTAYAAGDVARAKEVLAESEACLDANPGRMSDDEAAVLLGHIAWVHENEKEFEIAVRYYERVEALLRRSDAHDPAKLVVITSAQGNLLHDLGRTEAAREKTLEAYRIATTRYVGTHPWAREVIDYLVETLEKNDLRAEAGKIRELAPTELP